MLQTRKQRLGQQAEHEALVFLTNKGLTLLNKNFRCSLGEIDLIMRDDDYIVFVEVRSRSRTDYGRAGESVNHTKQRKITLAATYYLQQKQWLHTKSGRFDVVEIHYVDNQVTLDWYKNAFLAGQ